MADEPFEAAVRSTKYPIGAFLFVQRGLEFTVQRVHGKGKPADDTGSRHVDGRMLCLGLRDFAKQEYGLLARTVLSRWHINSCKDFGNIVFAMVNAGLMKKTESDTIRDFVDVYDFDEAFSPQLELSGN